MFDSIFPLESYMTNSFRLRSFFSFPFFFQFKHINIIHFLPETLSTEKKNNALLHLNYNVNVFVAKKDLLLLSKYSMCSGF